MTSDENESEREAFIAYLASKKPPCKPRWNGSKSRWEYRDGRPYLYVQDGWTFWLARASIGPPLAGCSCGFNTEGIVHRTHGPCYIP